LPGIPPREPPSVEEPIDRPDPINPIIPNEEDKPKSEVHYYPNEYNPVVALHVTFEKPEDSFPTPQLPEDLFPVNPIGPIFPMPHFPAPEDEFTGIPFKRFLAPETKPLPENDGPSVDPLPGIPPREPPSILEPEVEQELPLIPNEAAVEIFINIKKPQTVETPELLKPETRPTLVPEGRPLPLAPEVKPLPAPEFPMPIFPIAPETRPNLVPEVKPWPMPEEEFPQDLWPEYIQPTPLVDIYVHINSKGQASVVQPPVATPY
jgi:hypothetical protein